MLAPSPDFRYVGLFPGPRVRFGVLAAGVGACAAVGASLCHVAMERAVLLTVAAGLIALAFAGFGSPYVSRRSGGNAFEMAIVPWGVLVESDHAVRALRWAAIQRVQLSMVHGRDHGTPTTRWSLVTVDAIGERFSGRAMGAVPLERLTVHLDAYAHEAGHRIALDLGGQRAGEGPIEADCESLLMAARTWIESATATQMLDLPPGGYRRTTHLSASRRAVEVLGAVLRDRTGHEVDARAFAAVVAAELHATELADDLVALVQSPHPVIAAVARVAAQRVGVPTARVGALEEVAPFLLGRDVEALTAWGASGRQA
jgi:hypothetical protein